MARPPSKASIEQSDLPNLPEVEKLGRLLNPFTDSVRAALDRGLTYADNFRGEVREVTLTCPDDWVPLAPYLLNGWTVSSSGDRPTAGIRKLLDGSVVLRGALTRGAGAPAAGSGIFSWPPGYGPVGRHTFGFATDSGLGGAESTTTSYLYYSGGVVLYPLDEVRFTSSDRTPPRWATSVDLRLGSSVRPFQGRPGHVSVLHARAANSPACTPVQRLPDWEPVLIGDDKNLHGVRLHRIWGLLPGVKYTISLLVLPE